MTDVIFALATAPGRAAVAVIRLTGSGSRTVLESVAGPAPPPRQARLRRVRGAGGEVLDQALALWLPGPDSYTGEDSAELHVHGGAAVVESVSQALLDAGARLAEPGEFTRRAFENGRLDLAQAEAVADLVDAETQGQRRQALGQLDGDLSRRYDEWRETLIEALSTLEAAIDFPDEELPQDLAGRARPPLERLSAELGAALEDASRGERIRDGFRIAIIGAPNAGKSSLFNRLLERDAAIVTPIPGATRDVIEAPLVLAGFKVLLADMAGLRSTVEPIETEGVRRARAWSESAGLRLWVVDSAAGDGGWREAAELVVPGDVLVLNKADAAVGADADLARALGGERGLASVWLSAVTGRGLDGLRALMGEATVAALSGREFPAATRVRHRLRLEEARDHVRRGLEAMDQGAELAAEDLRLAGRALGRISGRIDPEDVLDRVFSSFCIGK